MHWSQSIKEFYLITSNTTVSSGYKNPDTLTILSDLNALINNFDTT